MNSANQVTIARMILIPVLVGALLANLPNWGPLLAAFIFIVLAATDAVDGYLARSRNEVTNFGKLIDPLADKLLVTAALVSLVDLGSLPAWVALVIISREFIVTGLRMVAVAEGRVIAAGSYGKSKTVVQIIAIVMFILIDSDTLNAMGPEIVRAYTVLSWIVMGVALILTIVSMIDYFYHARSIIQIGEPEPEPSPAKEGA